MRLEWAKTCAPEECAHRLTKFLMRLLLNNHAASYDSTGSVNAEGNEHVAIHAAFAKSWG